MGIRFACHACHKPLHIKAELAGKRGVCPHCGARIRIPSGENAYSTAADDDKTAAASETVGDKAAAPSANIPSANIPSANIPSADTASAPAATMRTPASPGSASPSLLDDPTAVWYVRPPSGGQYGPATGDVLRSWIAEARVTATSLVWRDGWPQWRSASEALVEFGAKGSTSPVPSATSQATRSRTPAPSAVTPILAGDAQIGARKSRLTNRRIAIVGGLAALSVILIGILIYLIKQS